MADREWLIYGAYGFSGRLIVEEAVRRGMRPIVAGRNDEKTRELALAHGLDARVAEPEKIDEIMTGVALVLNCAGPFSKTWEPVVEACLRRGAHYLDITGEIAVFEAIHHIGGAAKASGVALIPGVGFDVIPTDCVAAKLSAALPGAHDLELAFYQRGGGVSRGTMKTAIEGLAASGAVRRNGQIERVPVAWKTKRIPFSCGERLAMTIPWGDVATAFHTTGIPNIRVYQGVSPRSLDRVKKLRPLLRLAGLPPVRWALTKWADRRDGPPPESRQAARMYVWGEVTRGSESASMTLETPEGYEVTAVLAVEAVRRTLAGVEPGSRTPSRAFGADMIDSIDGVVVSGIGTRG